MATIVFNVNDPCGDCNYVVLTISEKDVAQLEESIGKLAVQTNRHWDGFIEIVLHNQRREQPLHVAVYGHLEKKGGNGETEDVDDGALPEGIVPANEQRIECVNIHVGVVANGSEADVYWSFVPKHTDTRIETMAKSLSWLREQARYVEPFDSEGVAHNTTAMVREDKKRARKARR